MVPALWSSDNYDSCQLSLWLCGHMHITVFCLGSLLQMRKASRKVNLTCVCVFVCHLCIQFFFTILLPCYGKMCSHVACLPLCPELLWVHVCLPELCDCVCVLYILLQPAIHRDVWQAAEAGVIPLGCSSLDSENMLSNRAAGAAQTQLKQGGQAAVTTDQKVLPAQAKTHTHTNTQLLMLFVSFCLYICDKAPEKAKTALVWVHYMCIMQMAGHSAQPALCWEEGTRQQKGLCKSEYSIYIFSFHRWLCDFYHLKALGESFQRPDFI